MLVNESFCFGLKGSIGAFEEVIVFERLGLMGLDLLPTGIGLFELTGLLVDLISSFFVGVLGLSSFLVGESLEVYGRSFCCFLAISCLIGDESHSVRVLIFVDFSSTFFSLTFWAFCCNFYLIFGEIWSTFLTSSFAFSAFEINFDLIEVVTWVYTTTYSAF